MPSILRVTDQGSGPRAAAFNFDDLTAQAQRYLDRVRAEAAQIVLKARQEAAAVRQQAQREGRQAALQAVEQMVQRQTATVLPALRKAAEEISYAKQAWLRQWEAAGVRVAAAIAERVIRRPLIRHPEITLTLIREALELAAGNSQLRIHLNPEDHRALGNSVETVVRELASLAEVEIVPNAEIGQGGCRVETRFGVIDQQFQSQLQRIEEELAWQEGSG